MVKSPARNVVIEYREKEITEKANRFGEKIIQKKKAKAWTLIEIIYNYKIKLVISQVDGRRKKFLSIMSSDMQLSKSKNKKSLK